MASMSCPDQESLERLLQGRIPAEEAEQLEEHLLNCDVCSAVADTMDARDEITEAARNRRVFEGDEEILAQVIERGKQLCSQIETVRSEEGGQE